MTTYTVHFFTEADWAKTTIKARTPKQALAAAQKLADEDCGELDFQSYDSTSGIERIEVWDADWHMLMEWQSADLRLRLAAGDLLEALATQTTAAQAVIDTWSQGDLAAAVRQLDASLAEARAAIAKAKGDAA